jgi:hypothetical protein
MTTVSVEAGPATFSAISTTMMPFLYHTRTLSNLTWIRASSVCRAQGRNTSTRPFSSSIHFRHSIDRASIPPTTSAESPNDGGIPIRRTTNMSGVEPSAGKWRLNADVLSFQEDESPKPRSGPRIRKFKTQPNPAFAHYALSKGKGNSREFELPDSIEFDEELIDEVIAKDEISNLTDKRGDRESTITDSERSAFQKIFSEIYNRSRRFSKNLASGDPFAEESMEASENPTDRRKSKSKLADIFNDAILHRDQNDIRNDMESVVGQYPPALRAAAAQAIGIVVDKEKSTDMDTDQLEALREPERLRIEGLMKAARTDFELWEVMEKEVFSLIPKLGLGDAPEIKEEVSTKNKRKKGGNVSKRDDPSSEEVSEDPSLNPSTGSGANHKTSQLALYGPLYPSFLLLGLRLLDRSFAKPSPLTLSLLPKIKSLGFISHVLGASTQFYNELLRIYRYRHDDFRGIHNLLGEMEHSALDLDEETLEIVIDIMKTQLGVHRGDKGSAIRALWSMPEFAPNTFRSWRDKIAQAMGERELGAEGGLRY